LFFLQQQDFTLARTALARWYRQNRASMDYAKLPSNVDGALNVIRKFPAAVEFLELRLCELSAVDDSDQNPHFCHALATYHELLGRHDVALSHVRRACSLLGLDRDELDRLDHLRYCERLEGMDEFHRELLWLHEKLNLAAEMKSVLPALVPSTFAVERRDGKSLSVEDFLSDFVARGRPLIITGMLDEVSADEWDLDFVSRMAGDEDYNDRRWGRT
jgi:hypothetical protein